VAGPRILVVDDDPDITDYFALFLEDHGYHVDSAANAVAAMDTIDSFDPHVVLVDVMMPGKSGLDLLVTLRRSSRWSKTPVVMITGNDKVLQDDCRSYLATHGDVRCPDGVLAKPIDRQALLQLLGKLCRQPEPTT
jgi:DNA-binding response OmpR family regulator